MNDRAIAQQPSHNRDHSDYDSEVFAEMPNECLRVVRQELARKDAFSLRKLSEMGEILKRLELING